MSVTSGFFNSVNGDRKYNAEQLSGIFDGIINDGVFANIGTAFSVTANTGNNITVGIGRAWFNSTWILNDALLSIAADESEVLLDRYDAVVIEIDRSNSVRAGSIKIVKGTAASTAQYPTMTSTLDVHQYPLAYIYRKAGSSAITQSDITNMVGTSSCPYITGILQVLDNDNIVAQWQDQFDTWLESLSDILDEDTAGNLAQRLLKLENMEIGGRNYILDSKTKTHTRSNAANNMLVDFFWNNSDYGIELLKKGGKFTIRFDYIITGITTACDMRLDLVKADGTGHTTNISTIPLSVGDNSGRCETTFTLSEDLSDDAPAKWKLTNIGASNNGNAVFAFNHIKLELGDVATDWSPAPEDLAGRTIRSGTSAPDDSVGVDGDIYIKIVG